MSLCKSGVDFSALADCEACLLACVGVAAGCVCWWVRAVWSACHRVADNAPTSLTLAHSRASHRARTARQSQDCLRVRSLSDPRLCAKAAQLAGALSATVGTGATALRGCVSLRHRATAFGPARCIHPRMRLAWLGRDTSRRPATPPRGVCRAPPSAARSASRRRPAARFALLKHGKGRIPAADCAPAPLLPCVRSTR